MRGLFKKGLQNSRRKNRKLEVVVLRNRKKKTHVAWKPGFDSHLIASRIIVASLYQCIFAA